jgi:hypothetical protein
MIRNVSLVNGQTDRLALPYSGRNYNQFIAFIIGEIGPWKAIAYLNI